MSDLDRELDSAKRIAEQLTAACIIAAKDEKSERAKHTADALATLTHSIRSAVEVATAALQYTEQRQNPRPIPSSLTFSDRSSLFQQIVNDIEIRRENMGRDKSLDTKAKIYKLLEYIVNHMSPDGYISREAITIFLAGYELEDTDKATTATMSNFKNQYFVNTPYRFEPHREDTTEKGRIVGYWLRREGKPVQLTTEQNAADEPEKSS